MESEKELRDLLTALKVGQDKVLKKVDRLEARMSASTISPAKQTWVKVKTITELTGWDREKLRSARENKTVTWKKNSTGFWYLLESLPERLIKYKTLA